MTEPEIQEVARKLYDRGYESCTECSPDLYKAPYRINCRKHFSALIADAIQQAVEQAREEQREVDARRAEGLADEIRGDRVDAVWFAGVIAGAIRRG